MRRARLRNRLRKFIISYRIRCVNTAGVRFYKYILSDAKGKSTVLGQNTNVAGRHGLVWSGNDESRYGFETQRPFDKFSFKRKVAIRLTSSNGNGGVERKVNRIFGQLIPAQLVFKKFHAESARINPDVEEINTMDL